MCASLLSNKSSAILEPQISPPELERALRSRLPQTRKLLHHFADLASRNGLQSVPAQELQTRCFNLQAEVCHHLPRAVEPLIPYRQARLDQTRKRSENKCLPCPSLENLRNETCNGRRRSWIDNAWSMIRQSWCGGNLEIGTETREHLELAKLRMVQVTRHLMARRKRSEIVFSLYICTNAAHRISNR